MKNFQIDKLWNLRGELDCAVYQKDYGKISEVKERYNQLVGDSLRDDRAFVCYNFAFWNDGEKASHKFVNASAILNNIENYERQFVYGEESSLRLQTKYSTSYLAGDIWVLRAMYDKFLINGKTEKSSLQTQQNMILGKAVMDRLSMLLSRDELIKYREDLLLISRSVREGYESIYNTTEPKIDYLQLAEDYWEN